MEITRFASDRLQAKIREYNEKRALNGKAKTALPLDDADTEMDADEETPKPRQSAPFKPIEISDNGLELIEWLSLDCTHASGAWHSDAEIKIDSKGYIIRNGNKTKAFWDAKISATKSPLRLRVRNIAGDESIIALT